MILAGKLPPDRAARARARLERAEQVKEVEPSEGPPAVGRQRSHHSQDDAIDIVIVGTPSDPATDEEPGDGMGAAEDVTPG